MAIALSLHTAVEGFYILRLTTFQTFILRDEQATFVLEDHTLHSIIFKTNTMNHSIKPITSWMLTAALIAFGITSCRRESLVAPMRSEAGKSAANSTSINENGNSAAAHIAASEKLTLPASIELPQNLPAGNSRVATYYAVGVQQYKARIKAGSDPVAYEWVFVAPQADLYDSDNSKVGTHGAGPFWELSPVDSIFAQQFSPAKTAPSPDPESIDWLLLMPKAGTTPSGIFADVDYIHRIATKGGKAPLTPPTNINETASVKYKAVYRFTKKNS
jgi:hypothetical protein